MPNIDPFSLKRKEKKEIVVEVEHDGHKFEFKFVEPDAADYMKILSVYQSYVDKYLGDKPLPFFTVQGEEIPISEELFKLAAALACQQRPINEHDSTYTVEHWCALSVVASDVLLEVCKKFNDEFGDSIKNR